MSIHLFTILKGSVNFINCETALLVVHWNTQIRLIAKLNLLHSAPKISNIQVC